MFSPGLEYPVKRAFVARRRRKTAGNVTKHIIIVTFLACFV